MFKKRALSNSRDWTMTLPDERYRAVVYTRQFLLRLLTTPRIPKEVKAEARSCLRHYPSDWDLQCAAEGSPDIFQQRMEDLHKFVIRGQQQQQREIIHDDNHEGSTTD